MYAFSPGGGEAGIYGEFYSENFPLSGLKAPRPSGLKAHYCENFKQNNFCTDTYFMTAKHCQLRPLIIWSEDILTICQIN